MPIELRDPAGATAARGPARVYVLPCVVEDLLKLGFSRDPLQRAQALHRRWFRFFDLDRALILETETVRDARVIELRLRRQLHAFNAPAPLTIREAAGGNREWYRGAWAELDGALQALADAGHVLHRPARRWFTDALMLRAPLLYDWAAAIAGAEWLDTPDLTRPAQQQLRDALDACAALGLKAAEFVPADVSAWYGRVSGR